MKGLLIGALVLAACAPESGAETTGSARSAILGGRASGDDENAVIYLETTGEGGAVLRCSGRIVAPALVLTSRHCIIKRKSENLLCNADGSPKDITDTTDVRPEPPERIKVFIGSDKAALRTVAVREVVAPLEVTVCRSDLAFLVLAEPGLDVRTPLRREPVKMGESFQISGWGYTSDDRTALPSTRSTLDAVRVTDVGPGFIPAGTFAAGGNSLCFGDSGAVALIDGAVVGTYSRIEGDPPTCSLEYTRNILTAIGPHEDLAKRAYAAIGEEPWYAGERPPWLPPEDAGEVVEAGVDAGAEPPPPPADTSCSAVRATGEHGRAGTFVCAGLLLAGLCITRRLTSARRR